MLTAQETATEQLWSMKNAIFSFLGNPSKAEHD